MSRRKLQYYRTDYQFEFGIMDSINNLVLALTNKQSSVIPRKHVGGLLSTSSALLPCLSRPVCYFEEVVTPFYMVFAKLLDKR